MPIELDPQEVLEHLYALGYYNITKEQLKEFIRDLKKLIKYDIRHQERKCQQSLHTFNKENDYISPLIPTKDRSSPHKIFSSKIDNSCSRKTSPCLCLRHPRSPKKCTSKNSPLKERETILDSTHPDTTMSSSCSKCHHNSINTVQCRSNLFPQQAGEGELDAGSTSEDLPSYGHNKIKLKESSTTVKKQPSSLKPCPSFIRPTSAKAKPPPKADPVALYHYYKSLWSQHTLPGENSHEDLRWRIRHRMMAPPENESDSIFNGDTKSQEKWKTCRKETNNKINDVFNKHVLIKRICKKCRGNKCEKCALKMIDSLEIKINFTPEFQQNKNVLKKSRSEEKLNKRPDWVES